MSLFKPFQIESLKCPSNHSSNDLSLLGHNQVFSLLVTLHEVRDNRVGPRHRPFELCKCQLALDLQKEEIRMAEISAELYAKLFNEYKDTLKSIEDGELENRIREMEQFIRDTKLKIRASFVELSERGEQAKEKLRISDQDYVIKPIEPAKISKPRAESKSPKEKAIESMMKAGMSEKRARAMFDDED